mgnify:FL=1
MAVAQTSHGGNTKPTHADVRYSDAYDRSTLDFWQAPGPRPAPLVVYFHGGGFVQGDKARFRSHRMLARYRRRGVAFASVNYPFLKRATYLDIMKHAAEAIRFLKARHKAWRIDPQRIAVMGSSAGAMIAEYLTYWEPLGISACYAHQQPFRSWFLLAAFNPGDPPLVLYTSAAADDDVHHPKNAKMFKQHCDKVGIDCQLYGTKTNGLPPLPAGTDIETRVMAVFQSAWQQADRKPPPNKEKAGTP